MNLNSLLAIVPRAMRVAAVMVAALVIAAGLIAGALIAEPKHLLGPMGLYWTAALVMGLLSGVWLLAVGYVHGDARLRGMRAGWWDRGGRSPAAPAGLSSVLRPTVLCLVRLHPMRHDHLR